MQVTTYYINSIPVYIRRLPSGCISIWHPYNLDLAKIIYQICQGRGYWNSQYKNWLVFESFVSTVVSAIEESGQAYVR